MNLLLIDITGTGITAHLKAWYPKLHTVIINTMMSLKSMSCFENFHDLAFKVYSGNSLKPEIVGG
jgi:hypothetical protein